MPARHPGCDAGAQGVPAPPAARPRRHAGAHAPVGHARCGGRARRFEGAGACPGLLERLGLSAGSSTRMKLPAKLPAPETLLASALFLMTNHAFTRCPLGTRMIAQQLAHLAHHPSETATPQLRAVCEKLASQWNDEIGRASCRE